MTYSWANGQLSEGNRDAHTHRTYLAEVSVKSSTDIFISSEVVRQGDSGMIYRLRCKRLQADRYSDSASRQKLMSLSVVNPTVKYTILTKLLEFGLQFGLFVDVRLD